MSCAFRMNYAFHLIPKGLTVCLFCEGFFVRLTVWPQQRFGVTHPIFSKTFQMFDQHLVTFGAFTLQSMRYPSLTQFNCCIHYSHCVTTVGPINFQVNQFSLFSLPDFNLVNKDFHQLTKSFICATCIFTLPLYNFHFFSLLRLFSLASLSNMYMCLLAPPRHVLAVSTSGCRS